MLICRLSIFILILHQLQDFFNIALQLDLDIVRRHGLLAAGGACFKKSIQVGFHQLESLSTAQHQSFDPVPFQVKDVSVAEEVAKRHIVVQGLNQALGYDGGALSSWHRHGIQQFPMPELTAWQTTVQLCGNTFEDILKAVIKGMEHCGKGGKLDVVRRAHRALLDQRALHLKQAAKLLPFDGDLLLQLIPHAAAPLLF
jgi:hypothetical protein